SQSLHFSYFNALHSIANIKDNTGLSPLKFYSKLPYTWIFLIDYYTHLFDTYEYDKINKNFFSEKFKSYQELFIISLFKNKKESTIFSLLKKGIFAFDSQFGEKKKSLLLLAVEFNNY